MNDVVAIFADGRVVSGVTMDFAPDKLVFHVRDAAAPNATPPLEIHTQQLKGLLFVKTPAPHATCDNLMESYSTPPVAGRRLRVTLKDGQVVQGTSTNYQAGCAGFFLQPADSHANVIRCYIVTANTQEIVMT